ncbi:MAG: hypothetical protein LBM21_02265, partial [Coriobacteriales bacterium]|nr:hypothetical protein [Coriobacteriales bacterium]
MDFKHYSYVSIQDPACTNVCSIAASRHKPGKSKTVISVICALLMVCALVPIFASTTQNAFADGETWYGFDAFYVSPGSSTTTFGNLSSEDYGAHSLWPTTPTNDLVLPDITIYQQDGDNDSNPADFVNNLDGTIEFGTWNGSDPSTEVFGNPTSFYFVEATDGTVRAQTSGGCIPTLSGFGEGALPCVRIAFKATANVACEHAKVEFYLYDLGYTGTAGQGTPANADIDTAIASMGGVTYSSTDLVIGPNPVTVNAPDFSMTAPAQGVSPSATSDTETVTLDMQNDTVNPADNVIMRLTGTDAADFESTDPIGVAQFGTATAAGNTYAIRFQSVYDPVYDENMVDAQARLLNSGYTSMTDYAAGSSFGALPTIDNESSGGYITITIQATSALAGESTTYEVEVDNANAVSVPGARNRFVGSDTGNIDVQGTPAPSATINVPDAINVSSTSDPERYVYFSNVQNISGDVTIAVQLSNPSNTSLQDIANSMTGTVQYGSYDGTTFTPQSSSGLYNMTFNSDGTVTFSDNAGSYSSLNVGILQDDDAAEIVLNTSNKSLAGSSVDYTVTATDASSSTQFSTASGVINVIPSIESMNNTDVNLVSGVPYNSSTGDKIVDIDMDNGSAAQNGKMDIGIYNQAFIGKLTGTMVVGNAEGSDTYYFKVVAG